MGVVVVVVIEEIVAVNIEHNILELKGFLWRQGTWESLYYDASLFLNFM
jgi:hypothetical protein